VRLVDPEFVMVMDSAAEVVVVAVFGKARADVESVAVGGALTMVELLAQPASKPRTAIDAASREIR